MKKIIFLCAVLVITTLFSAYTYMHHSSSVCQHEEWGFFGHRQINRMAVFTLPPEMIGFYKRNIEHITEHAVDPDKRRYATKHEAPRHYIDIDHWGTYPYPNVPREWTPALMQFTDVFVVTADADTLQLFGNAVSKMDKYKLVLFGDGIKKSFRKDSVVVYRNYYEKFVKEHIQSKIYRQDHAVNTDALMELFSNEPIKPNCTQAYFVDQLSEYGVIPWHLQLMQRKLTAAFRNGDPNTIMRLSADYGHYVGDAHVPLHTTTNYNGQLTNQIGIHAFWESRVVELRYDEFDTFVGKAEYIDDPKTLIWETILKSNSLVDSVLNVEKRLVEQFPKDQQQCFEERLDRTVSIQCEAFTRVFDKEMNGMVEERFVKTIHTLGSLWYTAWVDAGQPDLRKLGKDFKLTEEELKEKKKLDKLLKKKDRRIFGREH